MCCFKQKTAYEMRISDWSSDVCSSDLHGIGGSATIAPLDLTDGDSIARLASAMAERWQHLDMLVLNAAMLGTLTPVAAIDGKEFNRLLTLNLIAPQALIANFDPLLPRAANHPPPALSTTEQRRGGKE